MKVALTKNGLEFQNMSWLVGDSGIKEEKVTVVIGPADHYSVTATLKKGQKILARGRMKTAELRDMTRHLTRMLKDIIRFTASTIRASRGR